MGNKGKLKRRGGFERKMVWKGATAQVYEYMIGNDRKLQKS